MESILTDRDLIAKARISIRTADQIGNSEQSRLINLCSRVFADDFSRLFIRRPTAHHAVVTIDSVPVAHGCWEPWKARVGPDLVQAAWVSAMAVEDGLQGRGLGRMIMNTLVSDFGDDRIGLLSATQPRFYARLGWFAWLGSYNREGQDPSEPIMAREPDNGMAIDPNLRLTVFRRDDLW